MRKILNKYFGQNLDIQVRLYNLLAVIGTLAGITTGVFVLILNGDIITAVIDLFLAAVSFIHLIRSRFIHNRQRQVEELNRELTARNETLAEYDSMKSDFFANVAHEINTPLAIISASSRDTLDLLKETPLNIEDIIENQTVIDNRVKLIDNIVLDLMDTIAIERGRLPLNRQPVNLHEFLKNTCENQFKKLDLNNNRIVYDCQTGLPYIWADPSRLEQVIINLLSNAVRHTQNGVITVTLAQNENKQFVSVNDNGEGMDAEMARIALKQYVSTKADYWRHGIGLYVCRQIITAHGGDIRIESEKGQGTSVIFSFKTEAGRN